MASGLQTKMYRSKESYSGQLQNIPVRVFPSWSTGKNRCKIDLVFHLDVCVSDKVSVFLCSLVDFTGKSWACLPVFIVCYS